MVESKQFKIRTIEGKDFPSIDGETILDSASVAGLVFDHSCKNGLCGACKTTLLKGKVLEMQPQIALDKESVTNQFLTCCCVATSDILIDATNLSIMHGIEVKILPTRIDSLDLLSEDIMQVKLRLPPTLSFDFLEGQFIDVIGPNSIRRSYSIVSNSSNKKITLLIKRVKHGKLSDYWFSKAKLNDLLRIEGPKGTFYLRDKDKPLVFLATGTGIAPIISILNGLESDLSYNQTESISLFWGNRVRQDFFWKPNFKKIKIDFTPIVSRESDNWKGEVGYVQNIALSKINNIKNSNVYACGASEMINSSEISFIKAGLNKRDFYSDKFVQSF